ncbi:Pepsin A [Psilocybe cubensis]|uniref:Pepsin A n=2 Tax=Psilocybe cubensis TaxID=181762 RepID=A0ACB8GTP1_PSICU|nr:Pepsin A [Psilocybe cubensis]KAH9478959.1 Pepsin A [Psilocybe cubensis]
METSARWKGKARATEFDFLYSRAYFAESRSSNAREAEGDYGRQRHGVRGYDEGMGRKRRAMRTGRFGREDIGIGMSKRDGVNAEGSGGSGGIVLPLDMVGSGVTDVAYTLPVKFGSTDNGRPQQQFSLQVDTGSSDMWIASTSCSTSSCKLTDGRLYDPLQTQARATGVDFSIPYLSGSASGPVYWDSVTIGGYTIDNQALAAASDVDSEPLSSKFSGILGLALPLNSIIAASIPPVTSNAPDGAAWASNLFSITPTSSAPSARFLSLALERPGSDRVPSVLGIGRHPQALVPDPSKVQYAQLVAEASGTLFWKVGVRAITVYVDGQRKEVDVGRGGAGGAFPSAVVDSGVPLILATSAIANAVYGALGVEPASDGKYYIPCTTPLNLTFTLDTRSELPIHPLDLTTLADPSSASTYSPSTSTCVGLIQSADAFLGPGSTSGIGDMILGVPFLRNVYTVMAYVAPGKDGSFPVGSGSSNTGGDVKPRLGLLGLTDPTIALEEFHTVRVLNQPLSSSPSSSSPSSGGGSGSGTGSDHNTKTVSSPKKLSTGAIVGLAFLAFFVLCVGAVGVRYLLNMRTRAARRKERERELAELGMPGSLGGMDKSGYGGYGMSMDQRAAYDIVRGRGRGFDGTGVGDVTMVAGRGVGEDGVLLRERESERTLLGKDASEKGKGEEGGEFGVRGGKDFVDIDDVHGEPDDTLVARGDVHSKPTNHDDDDDFYASPSPPASPDIPTFRTPSAAAVGMPLLSHQHQHQYTDSDSTPISFPTNTTHRPLDSVDIPLLSHRTQDSQDSESSGDGGSGVDKDGDAQSRKSGRRGRAMNYSMPRPMVERDVRADAGGDAVRGFGVE